MSTIWIAIVMDSSTGVVSPFFVFKDQIEVHQYVSNN